MRLELLAKKTHLYLIEINDWCLISSVMVENFINKKIAIFEYIPYKVIKI